VVALPRQPEGEGIAGDSCPADKDAHRCHLDWIRLPCEKKNMVVCEYLCSGNSAKNCRICFLGYISFVVVVISGCATSAGCLGRNSSSTPLTENQARLVLCTRAS
jgi:hypothetical protein